MPDRTAAHHQLLVLLQAEPDSIPFVLGYLSPHLPTECMQDAVRAYERHLRRYTELLTAAEEAPAGD